MISLKSNRKTVQFYRLNTLITGLSITALIFLSGCQSIPPTHHNNIAVSCALSQSKNLTQAISQTQAVLSQNSCQSEFYTHYKSLVAIASGAPMDTNLETLASFSRWGVRQGIISQKQSEETLRRYFTPQLVSLEYHSDFNTYSQCSMSQKLPEIQSLLNEEIEQKRMGLAEALGDKKSYRQAVKEFQSMNLVLENISSACLDG